jgi:hypothetical protein
VNEVPDPVELSDGHLLCITTDNISSNSSYTCELQSTLKHSGIELSALRNHVPCMAHVIQLCLGELMKNLGVKGCTKAWETHECDEQFGENKGAPTTNIQKLRSAMLESTKWWP